MIRSLLLITALLLSATTRSSTAQTAPGDTLFSFNAGLLTPTPDRALNGIAFAEEHFWVTGFNPPTYDHRLYKISADGSELVSSTSLATGYHAYYDLAYDGEFLYATDRDHLAQIDPATGQLTGEQIPTDFGTYLVQGVAYDPATDHFWVIPRRNGQLQVLHEIDRAGTVLNTYPTLDTDYTTSLTWDTWSPGGPFLWTHSRETIGYDSRGVLRQFSPAIGAFTGVEIETVNRSPIVLDGPRGAALTDALTEETVTMITVQAGAIAQTDGLDWVVVYDADLQNAPPQGAQITVSPAVIDAEVDQDDTVEIPVVIGNQGNVHLVWDAYIESTGQPPDDGGDLGDVIASIDVMSAFDTTDVVFNSMTFARDHLWLSGRVLQGDPQLFKVGLDGALVESYPVGTPSGIGWRTVASDGDFIYGSDTYSIAVWSIDSTRVVDNVLTGSTGPNGLAYDPDNQHFYLGSSNGALRVIDRDGDTVRFVTTPYDIEGLAWDALSPGGPFLWAWVDDEQTEDSCCSAVQLDPVTGLPTGAGFSGVEQGSQPNAPEAAVVTRDFASDRATLLALQESREFSGDEAFVVAYDLDVALAPSWIDLVGPTVSTTAPSDSDTLMVTIHGTMADTTTSAFIRITSNDLSQPTFEIPVTTVMRGVLPVAADESGRLPAQFVLRQNFPNPFDSATRIRFELEQAAEVTLEVYDVQGRRVARLKQALIEPGSHEVAWNGTGDDGRPVASGLYLYTLTVNDVPVSRKMLLTK